MELRAYHIMQTGEDGQEVFIASRVSSRIADDLARSIPGGFARKVLATKQEEFTPAELARLVRHPKAVAA